jgi:hypothetical protein
MGLPPDLTHNLPITRLFPRFFYPPSWPDPGRETGY